MNFTRITSTPWHCPYCDRMNYEPGGKYEDGANVIEVYPFEDNNESDIISFAFECPHCKRGYDENYRATYLETTGYFFARKSTLCGRCETDRKQYTPMSTEWWWFFDTNGELGIETECTECGEHQTNWYKLEYVDHSVSDNEQ